MSFLANIIQQSPAPIPLTDALSNPGRLPASLEIALVLTLLALAPAIFVSVTCFTRIVIVLSFVRRAIAIQELPPNPVMIGLSLFLTLFVMAPTANQIYDKAFTPYSEGKMSLPDAGKEGGAILKNFLLHHTRDADLALFVEISKSARPEKREDLDLRIVVPAFLISEIKTAFTMGFLIFLPFILIDLVVSAILLSMGMFMLPPTMISTPLKVLLFVLVDGWNLVIRSLVESVQA
ncbi:MAG: flagellar type III secretion system pore protein FliP [Planctomycetes bacterium]|nr:flagellar type III secretion system pore protein FliP [Planctomycetota bacterium]